MTGIIHQLIISFGQMLTILLNPLFLITLAILLIIYVLENKKYKAGAYYQITHIPLLRIRQDLGKYGEYLTYKQLWHFEKDGAKFLFNVYVPKDNGETTEIDVLMITPKGIFVFESKNYSGWIFGNENQKNWYQTLPSGRGRSHKEHFYNPIMQNRSHIKHLQAVFEEPIPMYSIIVFSERCTLKNITVNTPEIKVINRNQVSFVVSDICKALTENVLSNQKISDLYNALYPYTQVSEKEKQQHISNIENKLSDKPVVTSNEENGENIINVGETLVNKDVEPANIPNGTTEQQLSNANNIETTADNNDNLCPKCGGKLVLRTAIKGANAGNQFLGCANFPKCRYVKSIK